MLKKTSQTLSLIEEIVERAPQEDRGFLEAAFCGYISALAYAEIERTVHDILNERFQKADDQKISHFASNALGKGKARISKSDIADLVKRFGEECKDTFNGSIDQAHIHKYANLITCRHNLAHGEPENETLLTAKDGIDAAQELLEALKTAIR